MTKARKYSVVSMFSGCGGLDFGFLGGFEYKGKSYGRNPFSIISAYDFDERCVETYTKNIGAHIQCRDLSTLHSSQIPSADLLIGGFPCQDFSICGPQAGLGSVRGRLYKTLVKYMDLHGPAVVVAENVPHLERIDGGKALQKIIRELESANIGYKFHVWKLFAPDYGVPQNRKRIFLIGIRSDFDLIPKLPTPTHANSAPSIEWAISDLERIKDEAIPNQSQYFTASKAKNGGGQGDEVSKRGEPAYTIRANPRSRIQFHYKLPRRLTVRECARLQTFPDSFPFYHSTTANIMQIGNAVPPVLAHHVATSIVSLMRQIDKQIIASDTGDYESLRMYG